MRRALDTLKDWIASAGEIAKFSGTVFMELVTGRAGQGGSLVQTAGWLTGVRAGVGAHTPVGPVRVEYGVASTGRGTVFVRLGRWF